MKYLFVALALALTGCAESKPRGPLAPAPPIEVPTPPVDPRDCARNAAENVQAGETALEAFRRCRAENGLSTDGPYEPPTTNPN